jgi:hypothetical protein
MAAFESDYRSSRLAVLALSLALAGAAAMLYYYFGLFIPRSLAVQASEGRGNGYAFGDDFYPIWLTTRQWRAEHRDPYSPGITREIQVGLFGRPLDRGNAMREPVEYRQFAYPAFADLMFWPTAALEFPTVRAMLPVVLLVLTAQSLWLWMLVLDWRVQRVWFAAAVILVLSNYPVLEALFALQPGLIVGFLVAAAAWALKRGRLFLAGVLMSFTLIKPQMTLAAIAYLLLWSLAERRRAQFWVGFSTMTVLLVAASLWVGPGWIGEWVKVLLGYHRYATPPLLILLAGNYAGPIAIAGLLVLGAWLAWRHRRASTASGQFWVTLSILLAITSVAILPGQAVYDHGILLPGILLLVRNWRLLGDAGRLSRGLLIVGAFVLFWPWLAAFGLIAVQGWISAAGFNSPAIFALPIRTAASLPFAVLALLACGWRVMAVNREAA